MQSTVLDGIALGCDYNPEQWDPAVWAEDVALMQAAGVRLVAINIFGWAQVNPAEGVWHFDDLDAVMDLLHAGGIRVNLGTGTASTPAWLTTLHPEMLPVTDDGTTRYPGGRQAFCPSSPVYRRYALELVERVAARYGDHPALALWHVSNEIGCHNAHCYCADSAEAFRVWLQARYGTVDRLNEAWGTAFWSQRYGAWDEILPPLRTLSSRNPAQTQDFHRFSSDTLLDHYRAETAVLRRLSDRPVTTNFMVTAHIRTMDYWSWAADMDVIANDHYLDSRLPDPTAELSFAADLTRGLAGGRPWMLMESSTGAVNWQPYNLAKAPGQLIRNALTHVARGADAVCFFQWRASVSGSEKFHSAMLPHAGTDSELWREVVALGGILERAGEVAGTTVSSHAALVFSWEAWWAADGESLPSSGVRYLEQVHAAYRALRSLGIQVDVVAPEADLTGYRMVVAPALYTMTSAAAQNLERYVEAGGSALVTFFSGIVDDEQRVIAGGYPGALRDLLGVRVEEFAPVLPGTALELASGARASLWTERGRATAAEVLDTFADGPATGSPALTRNTVGAGTAWYVGTALDAPDYAALLARVAAEAGVEPLPGAGDAVEVVRRTGPAGSYLFVVNHGAAPVELDASGHDLVEDRTQTSPLVVPAGAVRIIREDAR